MNRCNLCSNSYFMLHRFITPSCRSRYMPAVLCNCDKSTFTLKCPFHS